MIEPRVHSYFICGEENAKAPIVFTCEHATNFIPERYSVNERDSEILSMHWGYDIGVWDVVHTLVERMSGIGVLANFSRLLCDPNRDLNAPTLILKEVEGHALSFNLNIDEKEKQNRIETLYEPYHEAVEETLKKRMAKGPPPFLLAVHSFTPDYKDSDRSMDIGVLYDRHEEPAQTLIAELEKQGFVVGDNAPYSGKDGMMFSVDQHSEKWELSSLEIEIRQDHIDTVEKAQAIGLRLADALEMMLR
jgi:predicted N-formylglutamate amidohydrolase